MKANEFIRKHGWKEAKGVCNGIFTGCVTYKWAELNTDDLKRYVDAYELVNECGGLHKAKERVAMEERMPNPNVFYVLVVAGAIDDVESCQ